ncbi:MAG: hypothetical protein KAH20_06340 [Methylococcales bacterium]|nr:hypothetical protein [Methylococcales bacterium]
MIESDPPIAVTVRDLGVDVNTLHIWINKYSKLNEFININSKQKMKLKVE